MYPRQNRVSALRRGSCRPTSFFCLTMGSALLPKETNNTNTGCLSPDNLGDGGSSRLLHFAQGVLQETLPTSRATSFLLPWNHPLPHPSVPPSRPTALQTFRHVRAPPACTRLRSLPWLAREARHHLPELPFALLPPRTNTPHGADTGA